MEYMPVTVRSCCKSCSIPNGKLLKVFLVRHPFSGVDTVETVGSHLKVDESLPRKTASKRGLDRSQMEQPIKKNKLSYFATTLPLRPLELWERD